jgi:hypothetical protein
MADPSVNFSPGLKAGVFVLFEGTTLLFKGTNCRVLSLTAHEGRSHCSRPWRIIALAPAMNRITRPGRKQWRAAPRALRLDKN